MTNFENLNNLFNQSGWTVTDRKTESGATVVVATETTEEAE